MKTVATIVLSVAALALPAVYWQQLASRQPEQLTVAPPTAKIALPPGPLTAEEMARLGTTFDRPRITNVSTITGADRDNVLICDAASHSVGRISGTDGNIEWLVPPGSLASPCHAVPTDYDGDGDLDVAVAILGQVWPTDAHCGQVVVLQNDADQYSVRVLADHLRRITDVQPADFDNDGDIDFVVAEFGYLHGGILYLECQADGTYHSTRLLTLPGTIHVPVADYDNDGDVEFAAVVSQDHEEILLFDNPGGATFSPVPQRIWRSPNFDLGLAGMTADDLDADGDIDLLLSAGDNLELDYPYPQAWHGCIWLENTGAQTFVARQIGFLPGTYAATVTDLDLDGDRDVVLASMFNDWQQSESTSLAWLENDGEQNFRAWHLAELPTHLCTVTTADLTGDSRPEIVAGSLQIYPPYQQDACGVTIWSAIPGREP